jgi:selenocysteine lyase/cysteine desulfurase
MGAGLLAAAGHEAILATRFLAGIASLPGVRLYGIADPAAVAGRVPTFSFTVAGHAADAVARHFAQRNIYVWDGSFYAYEVSGLLGVRDEGVVRIGFAHYNTVAEVDRILDILDGIVRGR